MRSHRKTVWEEQLKNLAQSKRPWWWCVWSGGCCGLNCHPYAGRPTLTPPQSHVRNPKEEGGFCWQNDPKVLNSCLYFSLRQQIFCQLIQKRKISFHHLCIRSMATTTLRHFKSRVEFELSKCLLWLRFFTLTSIEVILLQWLPKRHWQRTGTVSNFGLARRSEVFLFLKIWQIS